MKALVFHKPKDVRVEMVPDPILKEPTDALIRVTSTAICGSDLHIYNGMFPQLKSMILGHEFMGVVEEVGTGVKNLKKGDRVVVPFPIACGTCFFCQMGEFPSCEHSNEEHYGPEGGILTEKGGGLFGYTDLYGGYDGGQAEYVRVPWADVGPKKIESDLADEKFLFLTDICPTGYAGVDWANMKGGETVAVFGCGPVGIMAMKSAWLRGASRVIGVDIQDYRRKKAEVAANAETLDGKDAKEVVEQIRAMTGGRGADVVIDAVGMEADRTFLDKVNATAHIEVGTIKALKTCFSAVRRAGHVSILGVYGTHYHDFPLSQMFDKGITVKGGQCPAHKYVPELLNHVLSGRLVLDDVMSHKINLSEAAHGYKIFNDKEDDCVKVVLKP
jgi:S-(hydroxymethyl)glutathione dehydrogenase/alcohol dehydrogenase